MRQFTNFLQSDLPATSSMVAPTSLPQPGPTRLPPLAGVVNDDTPPSPIGLVADQRPSSERVKLSVSTVFLRGQTPTRSSLTEHWQQTSLRGLEWWNFSPWRPATLAIPGPRNTSTWHHKHHHTS